MRTDGRGLTHATLTELRKRGVAAVQSGESPTQVAAALGVNLRTLFRWLALYRRGGWDQLDARKRGGRPLYSRVLRCQPFLHGLGVLLIRPPQRALWAQTELMQQSTDRAVAQLHFVALGNQCLHHRRSP